MKFPGISCTGIQTPLLAPSSSKPIFVNESRVYFEERERERELVTRAPYGPPLHAADFYSQPGSPPLGEALVLLAGVKLLLVAQRMHLSARIITYEATLSLKSLRKSALFIF